ncbi:RagB/SusD family nutrient uptake outer membrane protein [Pararcticibacter amylolyticus]|uniref:RagB/SusD family nutrient uptake outer membrane protein n=1 Tax=Pararcticibacter amylolyticus TaxID=2173175 RepID=A0A2U2PGS2_9SPHI|nr:RagB/SusD family nutrient uptake outer membrane protein [Pararcticibacter amylolyticus]PWG80583.1 RagB/SusD family nutrient uptake outer membrane protein [Pararcticibacter amylolyticus]
MNFQRYKIRIVSLLLAILAGFTSCQKFLEQVPDDRITMEEVFRKKGPSEQFLANVYSYVPDEWEAIHAVPWVGTSDEADLTWSGNFNYGINVGNLSPTNTTPDFWAPYYRAIRAATYFMNHINANDEIRNLSGQQLIDQYIAEARFLRAFYYFCLMREYGPVILAGEEVIAPDAPASEMQLPRSPYDECVNYVVSELDKAAAGLPLTPQRNGQQNDAEWGRATKGMALAVKSRLLLYAASAQYNGNTEVSGFRNPDGTVLIAQTRDNEKWKRAADAAKEVIDLGIYSLYKDPSGDPVKSLEGVFFQSWNDEQIFARKSNGLAAWDVHCMPRQAGGWCGIGPTQESVDAYFMSDGKLPSESALYSEEGFTNVAGQRVFNMYLKREPRFYRDVTYNNSIWQGGSMSSPAPISFFVSGPNGRNGHATDFSKTGYLVRKNVGPTTNVGSGGNGQRQDRPAPLFRLAEIYLNYAEALNEYEPGNADILKYLNLIRERAGIPQYGAGTNALPVPADQAEMRKMIRAERRIELAYEGHRWFDIRRWKIAPQVMGTLHGMDISKDGDEFYKRVPTMTPHLFRSSYYWWPVSQYELDRNKNLIQNPGW